MDKELQEEYSRARALGILKKDPELASEFARAVKLGIIKDESGGTNYAAPKPQASAPSISQYSLPAPGTPPPSPTPQPSMRVPGVTMRAPRSLYDVAKSLPPDVGAPAKTIQPAQKAKAKPTAKPTYVQKPREATGKTYSAGSMPETAPPRNAAERGLARMGEAIVNAGRDLGNTAPVQALEDSGMMDTRRMIAGLPVDVFMGTTAGAAILDARRRGDNKAAAQVMRDVLAAQGNDEAGAFSRAAAGATLPTAGGLYGAGVAGRAALPLAKMTGSPLGAMAVEGIAATGGAILGTAGVQNLQDKAIASILGPDAYREFQAQQSIDQQVNPTAVKAGGLVPLAATLSPRVMTEGLAQAPQALRDVRSSGLPGFAMPAAKAVGADVAGRVVGAAVPTAINQVVEWTQGKDVDINKAIQDMALFSFTKPNRAGEAIAGAGARAGQAGADVAAQAKQGAGLYRAVRSEMKSPTAKPAPNPKTNAEQFKEYAAAFHPDKHAGLTPETQTQLTKMLRQAIDVKGEGSDAPGFKRGQDAFWSRLSERAQTLINTDPVNVAARASQANKKPLQIEGTQPSEPQGTLNPQTQKGTTNANQEAARQGNAGSGGLAPAGAGTQVPDQGRTTLAPTPASTPAAAGTTVSQAKGGLRNLEVAPEDLGVMPGIQYKRGVNKEGVTDLLKGQTEYQTEHGGTLTAYKDEKGSLFVVDGHHRGELAKRAGKFTAPLPGGGRVEVPRKLSIQVLDAADGWTPEEARSFGVLKNLRENKGVAIDAADALVKTHSADAARADARRLPPTPLARDVSGLVLLDEAGRALVRNKQVDGSVAAGIGEVLRGDVQRQRIALEQAMKTDGVRSYDDGAALARAVRDEEIARKQGGQESMFGDEVGGTTFQSTAGEQAAIRAVVKKRLAAEQSSLLAVDKTEARAGEVFDTEGRRKEAGSVRDAKSKADALFEYDPDVKTALRQAASDVANGRISRDEGAKKVREVVLKNGALTLAEIVKKGNAAAPAPDPAGGGLFGDEPAQPVKAEGVADMFAEPEPTKAPEPVKKAEPAPKKPFDAATDALALTPEEWAKLPDADAANALRVRARSDKNYPTFYGSLDKARLAKVMETYKEQDRLSANKRKADKAAATRERHAAEGQATAAEREQMAKSAEGRRLLEALKVTESHSDMLKAGTFPSQENINKADRERDLAQQYYDASLRKVADIPQLEKDNTPKFTADSPTAMEAMRPLNRTPWRVRYMKGDFAEPIIGAVLRDNVSARNDRELILFGTEPDTTPEGVKGTLRIPVPIGGGEAAKRARQIVWAIGNARAESVRYDDLKRYVLDGTLWTGTPEPAEVIAQTPIEGQEPLKPADIVKMTAEQYAKSPQARYKAVLEGANTPKVIDTQNPTSFVPNKNKPYDRVSGSHVYYDSLKEARDQARERNLQEHEDIVAKAQGMAPAATTAAPSPFDRAAPAFQTKMPEIFKSLPNGPSFTEKLRRIRLTENLVPGTGKGWNKEGWIMLRPEDGGDTSEHIGTIETITNSDTDDPYNKLQIEKRFYSQLVDQIKKGEPFNQKDVEYFRSEKSEIMQQYGTSSLDAALKAQEPAQKSQSAISPELEAKRSQVLDVIAKDTFNKGGSPVEKFQVEGNNGQWYSPMGVPIGVTATGNRRSVGWATKSRDGVTVGKTYPTKEAWEAARKEHVASEVQSMAEAMQTPEDIERQWNYWVKERQEKKAEVDAAMAAQPVKKSADALTRPAEPVKETAKTMQVPTGAIIPEGAPKGLTFYEDMPRSLPASSVIHVARNSDGGIEGAFVMPHQGTEDSMRTTALEAKDFAQEETEFIGRSARAAMGTGPNIDRANLPTMTYSGIQSITVATDADGNISHAISGNGKMIAPIGSVEARAIAGDMDAFRQVQEAKAAASQVETKPDEIVIDGRSYKPEIVASEVDRITRKIAQTEGQLRGPNSGSVSPRDLAQDKRGLEFFTSGLEQWRKNHPEEAAAYDADQVKLRDLPVGSPVYGVDSGKTFTILKKRKYDVEIQDTSGGTATSGPISWKALRTVKAPAPTNEVVFTSPMTEGQEVRVVKNSRGYIVKVRDTEAGEDLPSGMQFGEGMEDRAVAWAKDLVAKDAAANAEPAKKTEALAKTTKTDELTQDWKALGLAVGDTVETESGERFRVFDVVTDPESVDFGDVHVMRPDFVGGDRFIGNFNDSDLPLLRKVPEEAAQPNGITLPAASNFRNGKYWYRGIMRPVSTSTTPEGPGREFIAGNGSYTDHGLVGYDKPIRDADALHQFTIFPDHPGVSSPEISRMYGGQPERQSSPPREVWNSFAAIKEVDAPAPTRAEVAPEEPAPGTAPTSDKKPFWMKERPRRELPVIGSISGLQASRSSGRSVANLHARELKAMGSVRAALHGSTGYDKAVAEAYVAGEIDEKTPGLHRDALEAIRNFKEEQVRQAREIAALGLREWNDIPAEDVRVGMKVRTGMGPFVYTVTKISAKSVTLTQDDDGSTTRRQIDDLQRLYFYDRQKVEDALRGGKPVPQDLLAKYPELAAYLDATATTPQETKKNEPSSSANLERDRTDAGPSDLVGEASVSPIRGADNRAPGEGVLTPQEPGDSPYRSESVPSTEAAPARKRGDKQVRDAESTTGAGLEESAPGSDEPARSGDLGLGGLSPEPVSAGAVRAASSEGAGKPTRRKLIDQQNEKWRAIEREHRAYIVDGKAVDHAPQAVKDIVAAHKAENRRIEREVREREATTAPAENKPAPTGKPEAVAVPSSSFAELVAKQKAAESVPVKLGDIDNIRETLPVLKPAQQDDVLFAENRFAAGKEPGVLFTNGTGTGKTFTGLGVIKRFERQGKNNILILAPSQEIIDAWITSAPHLNLSVTQLDDTKGPGEGIVVTTYANLSMNLSLGRRDWDLVLCDEAHKLMSNKEGDDSLASDALQAITLHPAGVLLRTEMLYPEISGPLAEARAERLAAENNTVKSADGEETIVKDVARFDKADAEVKRLADLLDEKRKIVRADVEARQGDRTKVVFLSATPFAYEKTTHYAEGYLFSYPKADGSTRTGYNIPTGRNKFMVDNFGWSMKTNKLTQPSAEVDRALLQREFNNRLKREGALSGRALDVPFDYDRKFILAESAIGTKIDQGLKILWNEDYYRPLYTFFTNQFGFLEKRYLLEALKAKEAIPIIREHLALGRKVVLFHDYNKGGTEVSPFDTSKMPLDLMVRYRTGRKDQYGRDEYKSVPLYEIAAKFAREHPEYANLPIGGLKSPIEAIKAAFPDVLQINGLVKKREAQDAVRLFQDDNSGRNLVIVQSAKGAAGISLHDTTGKFQRVQINLGMPLAPTTAIQEEGRIFRVSQASNAIIRYMTTGTNWERGTFAQVASKSGEAENLALGEGARALRDQFIQAYMDADTWAPGHEGEGTGGKEADMEAMKVTSAYDRAKTYYFQQQKRTSRTKALEGVDYFATPEPIGFKMVEWLDPRKGEALLEPSAGHAAIARWFPLLNERTLVEPSAELSTKAMAAVPDSRVIQGRFEDLNIVNKYEGIAMNPPFGSGGKTAFEHLEKAYGHLSDGGRIVALVPTGPAADKRLDKFLNEFTESPLRPVWKNSPLGEIYKGDKVKGKMYSSMSSVEGVVTMASSTSNWVEIKDAGGKTHRLYYLEKLDATGPRTEKIRARGDLAVVAKIKLPSVAFERAGTSVSTQILVLERNRTFSSPTREIDLTDIADIKELFDEIEDLGMGRRDARLVKSQDSSLEKVPQKPAPTPTRARGEDDLLESPTLQPGEVDPASPTSLHMPTSHTYDDGELGAPVAPISARVKIAPIPWDKRPLTDPGTLINRLADATGRAVMVARQKRGVAGSYRPSDARTTIRYYGDMETSAHEIGHAMDDLFNLAGAYSAPRQKSPWDAELLQQAFQATSKTQMRLALRRAEGVAEYLRAYAMNPAEAEALAPEFTKHVKATLPANVLKAFADFGVGARRLAGAPATEAAGTHILWGEGDQRSIRERLIQGLSEAKDSFLGGRDSDAFRLTAGDRLATHFQDYLRPVVAATQWARKLTGAGSVLPENDPILLMRLHSDTVGKVGQMLETGFVDVKGEPVIDPDTGEAIGGLSWMLEKALRPSVAETEKMMRLAAILGVAEGTLEKGQQLKQATVISGIGMGLWTDASTARAVLTELDQLPQATKDDLAETMRRYRVVANSLLAYMADSGRISHEDAQAIMDANQQYISLQRVMEDAPLFEGTGKSRRLATVAQPIKKLEGSMRQLRDPFVSLLDQTYKIVAESDRNRAIDAFVDLFRSQRALYQGGVVPLSDVVAQTTTPTEGKAIKVFHGGEAQHWEINDPDVYKAIKGIGLPASPTGPLKILAAMSAKVPRALITGNPAFAIRNVMRDMPERWMKSEFDSLPWDSFKKFAEEEKQRYALSGGTGMGFYGADRKSYAKAIKTVVKDAAAKGHLIRLPSAGALESYHKLLQKSELQGRLPEYRAAFRHSKDNLGYDDYNAGLYAAGKARELMDFAVAGDYLRALSPYVPFVNASIQGFTANYKAMRSNPRKYALKFLLFAVAKAIPLALIGMLSKALQKDKLEEYRALPAYQRDLFINLPLPWPDGWVSIPVGFEAASAASGIERAIDYGMGNKDAYIGYFTPADAPGDQNYAMKLLHGSLAQSFLPVKEEALLGLGGAPGALSEIRNNYDSFRQSRIVPDMETKLPIEKRKGASRASRVGQFLGKVISSDPRAVDHFIQGVGGGSGTIITTLSDIGRADKPVSGTRALGMATGLVKEGPGYGAPQVQRALTQLSNAQTQAPVVLKRAQDDLKAARTPAEMEKAKRELRKAASGPMVPAAINLTTSKRDFADARIEKMQADRAKDGRPPLTPAQEERIRRALASALGRITRPLKKDEEGVKTNSAAEKIEARAKAVAPSGLRRMGGR